MILQALKEYYDRKPSLPRVGFEVKEIPFVIVLDRQGIPVGIEETTEIVGKKKRAKSFLLPQSVKRSSGIASNILWDNPEYALGAALEGDQQRIEDKHEAFKTQIESLGEVDDEGLRAVRAFLSRQDKLERLKSFGESWQRLVESGSNVTFKLAGEPGIVAESPRVQAAVRRKSGSAMNDKSRCLVSGEEDELERLHAAIKGVWGAQTTGANIVSFNQRAFCSFGKEQGANSPVGKMAAFAYTTALNHLLSKDSKQRIQVGDASTVFWSSRETTFEAEVADFFGEPPKDDPDRGTRAVVSLFKSVQSGALERDAGDVKFYVLGLAPNASRLAVRFWIVDTVPNMAERFCRHFEDIRIVHGPREPETLSLFRLLISTAVQGKSENIPPNLAGDTMRAILEGLPYPRTLLQAAVRRIRADHDISYARAALIKACLNRSMRFNKTPDTEELKMSLDPNNKNIGYRLGRLFATMEQIQLDANRGRKLNATIRKRYYGAASTTPVAVFSTLLNRLTPHHLEKLKEGLKVIRTRTLREIIDEVDGTIAFPPILSLEDQGRFAVGYYHQMQDFNAKKTDNDQIEGARE